MRDVTKSMLSYAWAVSMFGAQQAANLFRQGRQGSRATEAFDDVTGAVTEHFDDTFKAAFRAGDSMQRGIVDLMMGGMGMLTPDRLQRVVEQARQTASSVATRATGSCCGGAATPEDQMPPGATFGRAPTD